MFAISPKTDIYLLKCPLEIDNENQLTFSNATAQFNYFNSLPKKEMTNCTYQREKGAIRFAGDYDDLIEYNYVMYRNTSFNDKWFYAYITNIEYANHNVAFISIEQDCFQTWQFDIEYKQCFVEREHVDDDRVGVNRISEGLELGEYIDYKQEDLFEFIPDWTVPKFVSLSSEPAYTAYDEAHRSEHLATSYIGSIPYDGYINRFENASEITNFIQILNQSGRIDSLYSLYALPKPLWDTLPAKRFNTECYTETQTNIMDIKFNLKKPINFGGYTYKNNKIRIYPYHFLAINNRAGSTQILKYEDFGYSENNVAYCRFQLVGIATPGGSVFLRPMNYENREYVSDLYDISCAKFPSLSWSKDQYRTWVALNTNNINVGISESTLNQNVGMLLTGTGAILTATGIGTGIGIGLMTAGTGMTFGAFKESQRTMATINDAKALPNITQGNTNIGDIYYHENGNSFEFIERGITREVATSIDNYFSMYGYKINKLKLPNITGRPNWNFVKCTTANLKGKTNNVPQYAIEYIKKLLLNGCTFWHNPSTFLDYSYDNYASLR